MERVYLNGRMVDSTKETILMIKNRDLGVLFGLTVDSMKESGRTVLSMVKANIRARTVFGSRVVGRWASVLNDFLCYYILFLYFYVIEMTVFYRAKIL
jgi:hypothetical protein